MAEPKKVESGPSKELLSKVNRHFVDVSIDAEHDNAISTEEFLEATESLVILLKNWTVLSAVTSDMTGNINKIRARYLAAPLESATLQDLVRNEPIGNDNGATGTNGLLWLYRSLELLHGALQHSLEFPEKELTQAFDESYKKTLAFHHAANMFSFTGTIWGARGLYTTKVKSQKAGMQLALMAAPWRADFFHELGTDQDKAVAQLREDLTALVRILQIFEFLRPACYALGQHWDLAQVEQRCKEAGVDVPNEAIKSAALREAKTKP